MVLTLDTGAVCSHCGQQGLSFVVSLPFEDATDWRLSPLLSSPLFLALNVHPLSIWPTSLTLSSPDLLTTVV